MLFFDKPKDCDRELLFEKERYIGRLKNQWWLLSEIELLPVTQYTTSKKQKRSKLPSV